MSRSRTFLSRPSSRDNGGQQEGTADACLGLCHAIIEQALKDYRFLERIHDQPKVSKAELRCMTQIVEFGHPKEFFQSRWFEELCDYIDVRPRLIRKRLPRADICLPIAVEIDGCHLPTLHGETLNMSRSGVLARVDQPSVVQESRCVLRILEARGRVRPTVLRGTVRPVERAGRDDCTVAIEFDRTLTTLKPNQEPGA